MTGGPPRAGGLGDGVACASARPVVSSRRSDPAAERTSLSFTEEMTGFYDRGASSPRSEERATSRERLAFRLTITVDDVDRFLDDREHLAEAEGWIDAAGHGGRRPIQRGWFNLFAPDGAADRRLMRYRLHFTDGTGQPRTLAGWKNIHHGPPTDIWPDTTTLYYRVFDGHVTEDADESSLVLGAGTLHISAAAFARQLTTFRTSGPDGPSALLRFGRFFVGQLWEVYGPASQHA